MQNFSPPSGPSKKNHTLDCLTRALVTVFTWYCPTRYRKQVWVLRYGGSWHASINSYIKPSLHGLDVHKLVKYDFVIQFGHSLCRHAQHAQVCKKNKSFFSIKKGNVSMPSKKRPSLNKANFFIMRCWIIIRLKRRRLSKNILPTASQRKACWLVVFLTPCWFSSDNLLKGVFTRKVFCYIRYCRQTDQSGTWSPPSSVSKFGVKFPK